MTPEEIVNQLWADILAGKLPLPSFECQEYPQEDLDD